MFILHVQCLRPRYLSCIYAHNCTYCADAYYSTNSWGFQGAPVLILGGSSFPISQRDILAQMHINILSLSFTFSLHMHTLYPVSASVTASPVSSTVSEESNAQFDFVVTGNPLPTVEWYKDTIGDAFRINLVQPRLTSGKNPHPPRIPLLVSHVLTSRHLGTYSSGSSNLVSFAMT